MNLEEASEAIKTQPPKSFDDFFKSFLNEEERKGAKWGAQSKRLFKEFMYIGFVLGKNTETINITENTEEPRRRRRRK